MSQWAASLVDPLALLWVLLCAIAAFLSWRRRWSVAGVCGASALVLFLVAGLPWPERLVGAMEAAYANQIAAAVPKPDAVVMLGGMHRPSEHDPFGFALGDSGQRLVASLEVARQYQGTVFVLGGSGPRPGKPSESAMSLLRDWIAEWRLYEGEILDLGICRTTHDEAVRLQQLKAERGWKQITIVTSALHMKRAEATIRKLNGDVAVVACDFRVYGVAQKPWQTFPFPQTNRLGLLGQYLHEVVGGWVYRWRGWI